ncbi:MAG: hypothetical protein IPJ40_07745 [Saprospirales bacterium]|nr:hypothetical protein [Saprospirales bacterium]
METTHTVYVKALSNNEWFGAWAPVKARQEWLRADKQVGLFTLVEEDLDEEDEYEFYEHGSLLIGVWDGEVFKVLGGVKAEVFLKNPGSKSGIV